MPGWSEKEKKDFEKGATTSPWAEKLKELIMPHNKPKASEMMVDREVKRASEVLVGKPQQDEEKSKKFRSDFRKALGMDK